MPFRPFARLASSRPLGIALTVALALVTHASASRAEPAACLSPDPAMWPASSRPYFMIQMASDTGMQTDVGTPSSCGFGTSRGAHTRCAVRNAITAYAGRVNFGLSEYATAMSSCSGACYAGCTTQCFPTEMSTTGFCNGCGPRPGAASTRAGANILVPVQVDSYWTTPPSPSNVSALLGYLDNDCTGNAEVGRGGATPLNGAMRDMLRYFSSSWTAPDSSRTYNTPLNAMDRACRSVNVILIADADENCDTLADAQAAASALNAGVTVGGMTFRVRTFVVQVGGGTSASMNSIASAGGTGTAYFATNESQISTALQSIFNAALPSETCDNVDNNCNGCTDEGSTHYCNVQSTPSACCAWATTAQRNTCLANYLNSITASNPSGNLALLPCTTAAQATAPTTWLCIDPRDTCDSIDNNCIGGVDEGTTRCGSPLHCPRAETCNGQDDNCNGTVDEGCPMACNATAEVCDGCDNDCDGLTDNGVGAIPCGLSGPGEPAYCSGVLTCRPPQSVPPGQCVASGGFNACSNSPQTEVCDGLDNNCDSIVDNNVPSAPCVPSGTPGGLVFGGTSQCLRGATVCTSGATTCVGFVGPSSEVCDGIDNDCDGTVDEGAAGVGQLCGVNQPPCTPGVTACVSGALVCQGGTSPRPEVCDGVDNDCNGSIDDGPLADAPAPGMNGCWDLPGNCCSFPSSGSAQLHWCPPPGASCNDTGTLAARCSVGALACVGGAWSCRMPNGPSPEVCDGLDNDCNGAVDDGVLIGAGMPCGSSVPPCSAGVTVCVSGSLSCTGGTRPAEEICDGVDNDCNGIVDDPMRLEGAPCTAPYDTAMFPGARNMGACQGGHLACTGTASCADAIGPQPEVCDGIDNDCDGSIDEPGAAPDGIDGSSDPAGGPGIIGVACMASGGGGCGQYVCRFGAVACDMGPRAETCNCMDDDCNGVTDDEPASGMPAICAPGASCVRSGAACGCAVPCTDDGVCAAGENCTEVTSSATGMTLGRFCVPGPHVPDAGVDAALPDAGVDVATNDATVDVAMDIVVDAQADGSVAMDASTHDGGTTNPSSCACRSGPPTRTPPWSLLMLGLAIVPIVRRRSRREVRR